MLWRRPHLAGAFVLLAAAAAASAALATANPSATAAGATAFASARYAASAAAGASASAASGASAGAAVSGAAIGGAGASGSGVGVGEGDARALGLGAWEVTAGEASAAATAAASAEALALSPAKASATAVASAEAAARALVARVAGASRAELSFAFELVPKDALGRERMGLGPAPRGAGGGAAARILLQGSSAVSLASAFNWYLKDFLNTTYDWSTYEAIFPATLPIPPRLERHRVVEVSYHMNVCTYGYSLAFVDWAYWEKHIDWMAMQGINLPLAFLGQEKVLVETFARFGIDFEELQNFISGPAFLPWFRMGNLQGWGGPVSSNWIESRAALQKKVLARMRSLGMAPVLPAFAGFVPPAFVARFPTANMTRSSRWHGFPDPFGAVYILEPTAIMYEAIGRVFILEQTKLYGTDHMYQCDTFNEMSPRSGDPEYLAASARAVFSSMRAGDPEATWLMQGWLFSSDSAFWTQERIAAYLSAVPGDRLWLLDLAADASPLWRKTAGFYGKPFIWSTLLNFGGQNGFAGDLPSIAGDFAASVERASPRGVGITMEGMWTNYLIFDFTLSQAWSGGVPVFGDAVAATTGADGVGSGGHQEQDEDEDQQLAGWSARFGARRYGPAAPAVAAGRLWSEIYRLAYGRERLVRGGPRSGPITQRPTLKRPASASEASDASRALGSRPSAAWAKVWQAALALSPQVHKVRSFRFDLVDIGRECLTACFAEALEELRSAVEAGDLTEVGSVGMRLLRLIDDLDDLLSTDENFMLGRWLAWARSWSGSEEEATQLEFNARNLLTLWGPHGEINDYAAKSWAGLVRAYYKPRWTLFLMRLVEDARSHRSFNQSAFDVEVFESVERPWQHALDRFPSSPEPAPAGDPVVVSKRLLEEHFVEAKATGAPGRSAHIAEEDPVWV